MKLGNEGLGETANLTFQSKAYLDGLPQQHRPAHPQGLPPLQVKGWVSKSHNGTQRGTQRRKPRVAEQITHNTAYRINGPSLPGLAL